MAAVRLRLSGSPVPGTPRPAPTRPPPPARPRGRPTRSTSPIVGGRGVRGACKPDPVPGVSPLGRPFLWATDRSAPRAANPDRWGEGPAVPRGRGARSLFGVAPGGACHAGDVAAPPVGSCPTVSPLPPRTEAVCSLWRFPSALAARALPGTASSWSPDFPRAHAPATVRPPARGPRYAPAARASITASPAASPASTASTGPRAPGRWRRRNAARSVASSTGAV